MEVPLRGPKASGIGDDIGAVRAWVSGLTDAARSGERFTLGWADIGGRVIGRNRIPVRASVSTTYVPKNAAYPSISRSTSAAGAPRSRPVRSESTAPGRTT